MRRVFLLLVAVAVVSGCSMAPTYVRPQMPVEAKWPEPAALTPDGKNAVALMGWKQFFPDKQLQLLIQLALENNRDLRVTAYNIERARALYRIQRAEQLPAVSGTGSGTSQRVPAVLSNTGEEMITREYSATVGLSSFELDFFGRIQSLKDEALEQFLATEEAYRSARISLVAEVAVARLTLAADEESLAIAKATLASQQDTYNMIKRRFELGVSSELQLSQAQTSVDAARVDIARYTNQVAADRNALTLIVGATIPEELLTHKSMSEFVLPDELPVGLPSEVLLLRPDILRAEHELKAANANIGAARASFFPSISLTASVGYASNELSDLFSNATRIWNFIPRVNLPIFEWGATMARLDVSEVDKQIAVAQYESAIQQAFREVADALVQRRTVVDQLEAQRSLVGAATKAYELSSARFDKGVDSFLEVLDSQRYMYSSQLNLVSVRLLQETNRVLLYKVLGGGWVADTVQPSGDTPS